MDKNTIDTDVRTIIDSASAAILAPRPGECLVCYVNRQLSEFGCNGTHRFAESFRDRTAPRATAMLERLSRMGACCCDCEMFLNAFVLVDRPWITSMPFGELIGTRLGSEDLDELRERFGISEPPSTTLYLCCRLVRRGSTQACGNWTRLRRW
ncbi:DUF2695 domain-containing protein [Brevibacterium oceani]|uniref:DUF2695 domain-containing protein n=1 Tax=Brevibacterium oceani TaxID=358099 RepID=UPI001B33C303|nr:DUF2695 domain-containing protein [Brevibacterium oceani]